MGKLELIPIAAIGRQLKQSVKVFHSLMLYRRLPAEDNMFHISVFLILLFVFIIDRLPQKCVNKFFVRPFFSISTDFFWLKQLWQVLGANGINTTQKF